MPEPSNPPDEPLDPPIWGRARWGHFRVSATKAKPVLVKPGDLPAKPAPQKAPAPSPTPEAKAGEPGTGKGP